MGTLRHTLAAAAFVFLAACGGSSDGPPKPLGRHFDDTFLAQLPLDQRREEIEAKQRYDIAVLESQKATADFNAAKTQVEVAKNEQSSAKNDQKSAELRHKEAEASADMNRVKTADTELRGAKAAFSAAENRYLYLKAYQEWLKALMRYTEHNMYWRESQYELAQAKLAQSNNIQPKGFKVDDYIKQESERSKKTADAKQKSEREKGGATDARGRWLTFQKEADKLLGRQSEYPDPMAPGEVKGTGYSVGEGSESKQDIAPVQDPTMDDDRDDDDDGGDGDGGGQPESEEKQDE
jgi:hypothetical protein